MADIAFSIATGFTARKMTPRRLAVEAAVRKALGLD